MDKQCNHNAGVSNTNINGGIGGTAWNGYCPYCQPKCPCCGRPYFSYPSPIYWQAPVITCQTPNMGQATC